MLTKRKIPAVKTKEMMVVQFSWMTRWKMGKFASAE